MSLLSPLINLMHSSWIKKIINIKSSYWPQSFEQCEECTFSWNFYLFQPTHSFGRLMNYLHDTFMVLFSPFWSLKAHQLSFYVIEHHWDCIKHLFGKTSRWANDDIISIVGSTTALGFVGFMVMGLEADSCCHVSEGELLFCAVTLNPHEQTEMAPHWQPLLPPPHKQLCFTLVSLSHTSHTHT